MQTKMDTYIHTLFIHVILVFYSVLTMTSMLALGNKERQI